MRIDEYVRIYEAKHDDELLLLAQNSAELTDEARAALHSELARRGLWAEVVRQAPVGGEQNLANSTSSLSRFVAVGEFLNTVVSTYRAAFWLFIALVTPAVVLGYYLRTFAQNEGHRIAQQLLRGELTRGAAIFRASIINQISYFTIWISFCVAYAGISSAVAQVGEGGDPKFLRNFEELRRRAGTFFLISTLLYIALLVGMAICSLIYPFGFFAKFSSPAVGRLTWLGLCFLMGLVISRFALSIPAVTLGACTVWQSLFRSDELTEGKWGTLFLLLTKSLLGGYVAGMLPFWIADITWPYVHFYVSVLTAASLVGVILVEPIWFIGFSLLYLNGLSKSRGNLLLAPGSSAAIDEFN